ncbi:MAG: hypothetical protein JWN15_1857 [Firmicutes bacterium]|nr:hypothetical protein [Bacillota bacterium]
MAQAKMSGPLPGLVRRRQIQMSLAVPLRW